MKNMKVRLPMYFIGLFIMTMGISFSVKSDLGVAPVSSVPYAATCVWGIEMGKATILFHVVLVILQILMLRKNFRIKNLLQIAIGIVFGYFTTFCNYCVSLLPSTQNMVVRIVMLLLSAVLIAFGIFLYVPADIMPLAGEGIIQAISDVTGIDFSKVKIGFDITLTVISLSVCLAILHNLGSVGIGTVISAFLVGAVHGVITKILGKQRDKLLKNRD